MSHRVPEAELPEGRSPLALRERRRDEEPVEATPNRLPDVPAAAQPRLGKERPRIDGRRVSETEVYGGDFEGERHVEASRAPEALPRSSGHLREDPSPEELLANRERALPEDEQHGPGGTLGGEGFEILETELGVRHVRESNNARRRVHDAPTDGSLEKRRFR